jgi:hypothetical protein
MTTATITTLRDALFATLAGLQDKKDPLDIDRARAVCDVAREITSSAKIEIDFLKITGSRGSTDFFDAQEQAGNKTKNGTKTIEQVPGGSITTHRIK